MEQKSKAHFDRRQGLNLMSMILKKSHQILFDVYMHRHKNNACLHEPFDAAILKKMEQFRTLNLTGDAAILPIGHQSHTKRQILNAYTDGKIMPKGKKDKPARKEKRDKSIKTNSDGVHTKKERKRKKPKEKDKEKTKTSRKDGVRSGELPELSEGKRQKLMDKMDAQGFQALMRAAKGKPIFLSIKSRFIIHVITYCFLEAV